MPTWFYVAMTMLFASQFGLVVARHRDSVATVVYGLVLAAWIMSIVCVTIARLRPMPATGSLQLSGNGFAGTLDRLPVTIRWWEIARVHDLDDAIVLFRRRSASPVVIPKSAIIDVPAFWSLLEEHLVSKRAAGTSSDAAKQILNTVY